MKTVRSVLIVLAIASVADAQQYALTRVNSGGSQSCTAYGYGFQCCSAGRNGKLNGVTLCFDNDNGKFRVDAGSYGAFDTFITTSRGIGSWSGVYNDYPKWYGEDLYAECFFDAASEKVVAGATSLPPNVQILKDLAENSPEELLSHIKQSPLQAKVRMVEEGDFSAPADAALPTVLGHGMGDSCFEPGFSSVTRAIGKRTNSYAKCIPTGNNIISDTINGFLMDMDKSVDIFAEKIRADDKLKGGFNAIGFSQGNSLIRGYIQKYNDPPVNTFISVHGTVMGVAAFPQCFDQGKPLGLICKALAEVLGDLCYNSLVQGILFQADYYRDPAKTTGQGYLKHSQIAQWNNEGTANATLTANFGKTKKFAMVKALKDSMVYPNQGEHWGSFADGSYSGEVQDMKDTKFYKQDLFGLKTADAAGKIFYETTPGDHLQFTDAELNGWVDKYFLGKSDIITV